MLRVRKVIDFFYRFRFVFIGAAVVTAATITTLDLSKGSITESSEFEISYTYGEEISYSGSAFMGKVTFEFRRVGDELWNEEEPHLVGQYEARGKSMGNHGYKYTKISTFEIKPYETTINLLNTSIDFGNDHPDLTYNLLPGDSINDADIRIHYDDLTSRTTFARIDLNTIKVTDKDGHDITSCYTFTTEDKEITFNKAPLQINFVQGGINTYDGGSFASDEYVVKSGKLYYDGQIKCTGGISVSTIGKHNNTHEIRIVGADGVTDYTENYDIKLNDNYIEIEAAPSVRIESKSLEKVYDGKNCEEFNTLDDIGNPMVYELTPGLLEGHHLEISFEHVDTYKVGGYQNRFEFDIVDKEGNSVDRTLYKGFTTVFGDITIKTTNLNIISSPLTATFDNRYHSMPVLEEVEGLADGDTISIKEEECTSVLEPTPGESNVVVFDVMHGEEKVTDCYNIVATYKQIKITVTPLRFKFTPVAFEYDGTSHPYYITEGNDEIYTTPESHENAAVLDETFNALPEGWTYDVRLSTPFNIRNVKDLDDASKNPVKGNVSVSIYDNSEPKLPVASYYIDGDYLTFDMPKASISPKALHVTVKDYVKEYNNKSLAQDIVIDPNDPSTCVEYDGLVGGDLPDVTFLSGQNNQNANDGVDDEPYSISLSYGVQNSSRSENLTDNYNMTFENEKKTIDATITKKDIVISPTDVYKTYDDDEKFAPQTPTLKPALNENLIGETVSLNNNLVGTYETDGTECGSYEYELDPRDISIKIGSTSVTNNYNIHFEKKGNVFITERSLVLRNTNNSKPGSYIFYDKKEHGVFMNTDGTPSAEMQIDGLLEGHKVSIANTFSTSAVGDVLDISSSEDLGVTVVNTNDGNKDVTSNYNISHNDFHIDIVQTKVTIYANLLSKTYDGFSFESETYKNLNYEQFYSYSSSALSSAYTVIIESTTTGNKLQAGHELQVTKYSEASALAAIDIGSHPLDFDYRIVETSTGNDVTDLYNITDNKGEYNLYVDPATVWINCNSRGEAYNGQNITVPINGEAFQLGTNSNDPAYIANSQVGAKFSQRFSFSAQFDDGGYDPTQMYMAGVYSFNVTITINDSVEGSYAMNGNPNINVYINKSTYDYTITKSQLKITTTGKSATTGKELRRYEGVLGAGDKIYFGGVELLEPNKRKVYTYDITDYVIIHEADGTDVTTKCYDVSVG